MSILILASKLQMNIFQLFKLRAHRKLQYCTQLVYKFSSFFLVHLHIFILLLRPSDLQVSLIGFVNPYYKEYNKPLEDRMMIIQFTREMLAVCRLGVLTEWLQLTIHDDHGK